MIGVEAMVTRRSTNERTAVGRRSLSRRLRSLTLVRFRVSAIEKNAMAAVIIKRGSPHRCCRHPGRPLPPVRGGYGQDSRLTGPPDLPDPAKEPQATRGPGATLQ